MGRKAGKNPSMRKPKPHQDVTDDDRQPARVHVCNDAGRDLEHERRDLQCGADEDQLDGVNPATVASYNDVTVNIIAKNTDALNSMKM
jgi:hypothetical protein